MAYDPQTNFLTRILSRLTHDDSLTARITLDYDPSFAQSIYYFKVFTSTGHHSFAIPNDGATYQWPPSIEVLEQAIEAFCTKFPDLLV